METEASMETKASDQGILKLADELVEEVSIENDLITNEKEKTIESLCMLGPEEVDDSDKVVYLIKPCGLRRPQGEGVYCRRYLNKTCEYMQTENGGVE